MANCVLYFCVDISQIPITQNSLLCPWFCEAWLVQDKYIEDTWTDGHSSFLWGQIMIEY